MTAARKFVLAAALAWLAGCAGWGRSAEKPDLPQSVAPGWTRQSFVEAEAPAGLPATNTPPKCWLASYTGPGSAEVRTCTFAAETQAFEAGQRFPNAAETVKFQIHKWFVVVHWSGVSQTDATALVRAVQRVLQK